MQRENFPAVYSIKYSAVDAPEHYSLGAMVVWATVPYAIWQLSYHFLITVRRREKIAAGRPTSFTWLRRSYAKNFLGRLVLRQPEWLQEPTFMLIQYTYAILTMVPCPLWFWYRWASAFFLMIVFTWATYNGATFYIDVFGKRMEKELQALRKDVQRWQSTPDSRALGESPLMRAGLDSSPAVSGGHKRDESIEALPPLDQPAALSKEDIKGTTSAFEKGSGGTGEARQRAGT